MAVLGYLPKFKSGLELSFGADFLAWFFHTNAPYLILYQLTKFQQRNENEKGFLDEIKRIFHKGYQLLNKKKLRTQALSILEFYEIPS